MDRGGTIGAQENGQLGINEAEAEVGELITSKEELIRERNSNTNSGFSLNNYLALVPNEKRLQYLEGNTTYVVLPQVVGIPKGELTEEQKARPGLDFGLVRIVEATPQEISNKENFPIVLSSTGMVGVMTGVLVVKY